MTSTAQKVADAASKHYNTLTAQQKKDTNIPFIISEQMRGLYVHQDEWADVFKKACSILGWRGGKTKKVKKYETTFIPFPTPCVQVKMHQRWWRELSQDINLLNDIEYGIAGE